MQPTKTLINQIDDLIKLLVKATVDVTDTVEITHRTISSGPRLLGRPFAPFFKVSAAPAYIAVKHTTVLVGKLFEHTLGALAPLTKKLAPIEEGALLAVLNGVYGDYLATINSSLAIDMQMFDEQYRRMSLEDWPKHPLYKNKKRILILIHGSCLNERCWQHQKTQDSPFSETDPELAIFYLRYNSGLHISDNGESLAQLLETLVSTSQTPVDGIDLVGHSMGGLVARSSAYYGESHRLQWRKKLRHIMTIGTPHSGASLARWGYWFEQALKLSSTTQSLTKLSQARSAGVKDLRFGFIAADQWHCQQEQNSVIKLPDDVTFYLIAGAQKTKKGTLRGDGLVSLASALAHSKNEQPKLSNFPRRKEFIVLGANHLELLSHPKTLTLLAKLVANKHSEIEDCAETVPPEL